MPECPFLADCANRFAAASNDFETLTAGLDADLANWKPASDRWSVAECIEHLNVSAGGYFPRMVKAIHRGRERGRLGSAPYPQKSLLGQFILRALDPNANKKVPAPRVFRPQSGPLDFDDVCRRFLAGLETFRDLAEEADGLDLGRLKLSTPVAPFPRLTLAEAFSIHSLHIPRHLAQAVAVTRESGFPTA